jgi:Glycosyltransferase family 29 (sialyltransferase)
MWNKRLNDKFENRLIGYCQDKRVLVVGNSISLFNKPYGEFIDSFDVVVRMGKGYPWPEFKEHLGSKTDVWVLSMLRANHYVEFKDAAYKVLNISQISLYDSERTTTSISKHFYDTDFQIYRDYFLMGDAAQTKALIKKAYGSINVNERASQGALTLSYFTNIVRSYKELHVIGFDFFEGRVQYELMGAVNEVSSFHLPVPSVKGTNSNPHAGLYTKEHMDKKYILSLKDQGKIIFHEMDKVENTPREKIDLMMARFRKHGTFIKNETMVAKDLPDNPEITKDESSNNESSD